MIPFSILLVTLVIVAQRSFVDPAPINEEPTNDSSLQDDSVRQLENLKQSIGKTLAMMKSQSTVYTDLNGQKETHSTMKEEVKEDGKLVAKLGQQIDTDFKEPDGKPVSKVTTNLDIPSQGIHKSVMHEVPSDYEKQTKNGNRRTANLDSAQDTANTVDNEVTGSQYTPLDMAEYVFWTGDEKGVALAIEEFLQEGLMSREEAISFLQEIKYNLDYLKNHYTQLGLNSRKQQQQRSPKEKETSKFLDAETVQRRSQKPEFQNGFEMKEFPQQILKTRDSGGRFSNINSGKSSETDRIQDEDYDELLERLRVADFLYTEYSLEEVIYQLAKVMFTQSLTRGSTEAQQALQKFTDFLETEADQGHISRALEKKVLDVLIASLTDTLSQHPHLLSPPMENVETASYNNADKQNYLRQILIQTSGNKIGDRSIVNSYKGENIGNNQLQQLEKDKISHIPIGLGKYKNS